MPVPAPRRAAQQPDPPARPGPGSGPEAAAGLDRYAWAYAETGVQQNAAGRGYAGGPDYPSGAYDGRDFDADSGGYEDEPEPALSAVGAFGGGGPDQAAGSGRLIGLRSFDPGRRGAKALAVVAVLVIVIAAFLAWRARPRVDAVAPPSFDGTGSTAGPGDGPAGPATAVAASRGAEVPAEVVVAVAGKVRKPGLVRLPAGSRVADALTAAGGVEPAVDVAMLNLARKVVDGELILVGVTPSPGTVVATGAAPAGTGGAPAGGPVNLNTATLADLDGLPGVGPVLAQRILAARDAQGGFKSVGDLRKVDGIGDARYDQLKDLVTV
ncbi:helix-hairpin-helix domain-containing protein [Micromonosporaceae bacterium Da 78-11]